MIPSATYMIVGLITGKLLRSNESPYKKLKILIAAGIGTFGLGLALSTITPIIKKISTSSFVVLSTGVSLLFLALAFWVVDLLKFRRLFFIPLTVGMNPLFIFLFARSGGADWISDSSYPFLERCWVWPNRAGWKQLPLSASRIDVFSLLVLICKKISLENLGTNLQKFMNSLLYTRKIIFSSESLLIS